jgi:hypothetical protein
LTHIFTGNLATDFVYQVYPNKEHMMKRKVIVILGVTAVLSLLIAIGVSATGQSELAQVRAATAQFHRPEAARAAGWDLVPGLDHCFDNPGVGAMGFHYINMDLLDLTLDPRRPEAMVYTPGQDGKLHLGAVEYIVPAGPWDAEYDHPPMVLGQHLHLNEALGVYVLHAWIWRHNPAGVFEDWNPNVSCPAE